MSCRALLVAITFAGSVHAQPFEAIHGASGKRFDDFIAGLEKKGLRPDFASALGTGAEPTFSAVAVANSPRREWEARVVSATDFQKSFDGLVGRGFRPLSIWPFRVGATTRYVGVWIKDPSVAWQARHGITPAAYQKAVDELSGKGFRVLQATGCPEGKEHRMTAIFVKDGKEWVARHGQTEKQYQGLFDTFIPKGFHPASIAAYPTEAGTRFAAVFLKGPAPAFDARHGLTADGYQKAFNDVTSKGFRPTRVVAYPVDGGVRYAAIFVKGTTGPLPMSGTAVASLKAFDDAMQKFMSDRSITAGTLAVAHDGKIVLARGYGWQDRDHKILLGPHAVFRLASVSKPITLAALLQLIREGKLKRSDHVFTLLALKANPGQTLDKRWRDITIDHLIKHEGGWDRKTSFDPMFRAVEIASALGLNHPADAQDVIQYMLGKPLQFNPGARSEYSNFGYCVLGRVIEKASGKNYISYLRDDVLAPRGIKGITLGRSLPKFRSALEPVYIDGGTGRNVFELKKVVNVSAPDGSFHLEAMDAHGGLISNASDVVRFLNAFWMDGQPRKADATGRGFSFFGSLPGTWTAAIQRADGVNMVALFNRRDGSSLANEDIRTDLNRVADGIKGWPK